MADQTDQMVRRNNGGAQTESQQQQRTQMARWSPFAILEELQDELARLWAPFSAERTSSARQMPQLAMSGPPIDMLEQDGNLVIKVDLPGIKKEDVQVE